MAWAWGQSVPTELLVVLLKLADCANDEGIAWPSLDTLARDCKCEPRTARRRIGRLIQLGLVARSKRFSDAGRQTSNTYSLLMVEGGHGCPPKTIVWEDTGVRGEEDTGVPLALLNFKKENPITPPYPPTDRNSDPRWLAIERGREAQSDEQALREWVQAEGFALETSDFLQGLDGLSDDLRHRAVRWRVETQHERRDDAAA